MDYLPLCFKVKKRSCLIIGGGTIAYRKAVLLNKAGAIINVVAPKISPKLAELAEQSGGVLTRREYHSDDLLGHIFIIGATDIEPVNERVAHDANLLGLLVNIVDSPDLCNVIFPALIDRTPLLISVSSSGSAPVLARAIRSQIESSVAAHIGELGDFIAERRSAVRVALDNSESRVREFWENMLDSEISERVLAGRNKEADELFDRYLQGVLDKADTMKGEVYLVGAGPGDPDLLTFKALRLMQRADVVLYDRLVAPAIVDMTRRDAERIYVGKARSNHALPQGEINQLLIDLAKAGSGFLMDNYGQVLSFKAKIPSFFHKKIKVNGEMSMEEGTPFSYDDIDEMIDMIVENNDTARHYIHTLYDDNEDNLVDLPLEILDKEFSSDLNITDIICYD